MSNTALEQMQTRLTAIEESFSRLLNHLPGMAYRCKVSDDYNYALIFVSKGSETLLGIKPDDIVHSTTNVIERMMVDENDLALSRSVIHDNIVARKPYEIFYRAALASGEVKWIWDQGEGVFDEAGNCTFLEGIMMDVTEQKTKELLLWEENMKLRSSIKNSYGLGQIVGKSEAMQDVYALMVKAAQSDTNVIFYGETGVGKDLAARTVHELNGAKGRYVPVNCAAIPEQLLESEFFGHVKGAFSGASSNHAGYLAAAHEGTLFLDEIAELPLKLQVKLLRAIESKTYTPVGSAEVKRSNFRLISATNQDLTEMVRQRAMRADFFYRIHVLAINLPPLRARHGDLPLLIDAYAKERGITEPVPASVRLAMERYSWPGNVRELQNSLDRFWAFGDTGLDFGKVGSMYACSPLEGPPPVLSIAGSTGSDQSDSSLCLTRGEAEKIHIRTMLDQCCWRKDETAAALGITLRTLQRKIKKYELIR